jgi:hypothetical protein
MRQHAVLSSMMFLVLAGLPPSSLLAEERGAVPQGGDALERRLDALERETNAMRAELDDQEIARLRSEAASEAASDAEEAIGDRSYVTASRSLQMLNPEISLAADFVASFIANDGFYADEGDRSGMPMRALDLHIQSSLDPFSLTKIALGVDPDGGLSMEEVYILWNGVVPSMSFMVGRFRQQLGRMNRWHEHDLDQVTYPLAITTLFGGSGLAQDGFGLRWMMPPLIAHANELTLEVTDGSNRELYAGEHFTVPTALLHLKSYYDLSESTYLELGLSGQLGYNNRRGYQDPDLAVGSPLVDEPWRKTWVAAADLTLHWEPLRRARYRSLTWRSEGFYVQKETALGDSRAWGAYSYLQYQLGASWYVGARGDVVRPGKLTRLASGMGDSRWWDGVGYVTFWQSEFVYFRLQVQHGEIAPGRDTRVLLQVNWAAGPHKHEKY